MWTEIAAMALGGLITESGRIGLETIRDNKQDLDEWYEQGISLASHGKGICDSARKRSNLNYGKISNEANKLSIRLDEHLNPYPNGADKGSVQKLRELQELMVKLSVETETSEENPTDESLNEMLEMAQKESNAAENLNMGEVIEESKEHSPLMKNILNELDINSRSFGPEVREKLEEVDSIEELIEAMSHHFEISQSTVEQKVEKDLMDEEWDENLSKGIRIQLQITSNMSQEAINHLSEVSSKPTAK